MNESRKKKVTCWYCGKKFLMEPKNIYAGRLFCSDKCKIDNLKRELKLEKESGKYGKNKWRV